MKRTVTWMLGTVALLASEPSALACAACFGKSDSALAYGMNAGILTLLAVIGTMLACVASFFVFIVRRASRIENGANSEENAPQS